MPRQYERLNTDIIGARLETSSIIRFFLGNCSTDKNMYKRCCSILFVDSWSIVDSPAADKDDNLRTMTTLFSNTEIILRYFNASAIYLYLF